MENQNTHTTTSSEGWISRIMGSIKGIFFGVLLILAAFIVLWLNEGNAVKTAKGLTEGAAQITSIDAQSLDLKNDNKLVHLSGRVLTKENLEDKQFDISVNALKLKREVYMYQWFEKSEKKKEKQLGGSEKTITNYSYEKKWSRSHIKSNEFKVVSGHKNPLSIPYSNYIKTASTANIGAYELSSSMLSQLSSFSFLSLESVNPSKHGKARLITESSSSGSNESVPVSKIYIGEGSPTNPKIGDLKISFELIKSNEEYSLISKQVKNSFEPYQTKTGTEIQMISKGILSAENMFSTAQSNNKFLTWVLRLLGFLIMFFGLSMIFKPLVVLADVLPFLGNIVSFGLSFFVGLLAFGLSFITIAAAWLAYRPVLGIGLLVIGLGIGFFIFTRKPKNQ